jgi:hypothetical protein
MLSHGHVLQAISLKSLWFAKEGSIVPTLFGADAGAMHNMTETFSHIVVALAESGI